MQINFSFFSFFLLALFVLGQIEPAVSQEYGTTCTLLSNCTTCTTTQSRCLQCSNSQYLDLTTYQCISTCRSGFKAFNASGFLYCRNYVYYIDPTSTSTIGLGTFEYPFYRLVYPFRELWNYYIDYTDYSATIYIKQNTTNNLNSVVEPLLLIQTANVTIYPYSSDGSPPTLNPLIMASYTTSPNTTNALFSPLATSLASYNLTGRVAAGHISSSDAATNFIKFAFFQAQVTIKNINLAENTPSSDAFNLYFSYGVSTYTINIQNCIVFNFSKTFAKNTYFQNQIYINNTFYITAAVTNGILISQITSEPTIATCTTKSIYVLIQNNTFIGNNPPTIVAIFRFLHLGVTIVKNNYFYNCTSINSATTYIQASRSAYCFTPLYNYYQFDSNTIDNSGITSLSYAWHNMINYKYPLNAVSLIGFTDYAIFTNNIFQNMVQGNPILPVSTDANVSLTIQNNTFTNITFGSSFSMISFIIPATSITLTYSIVNNTFKNITTDQILSALAYNGVFANNSFNQIYSSSSSIKSTALFYFQSHTSLVFSNNKIRNSILQGQSLVKYSACTSTTLTSFTIRNVTLTNNHAIVFSLSSYYYIDTLSVKNYAVSPQSYYLIDFDSLSSGQNAVLTNIDYSYSYGPLFQVRTLTSSSISTVFTMANLSVQNNTVNTASGMFNFGLFDSSTFSIVITNLTVYNISIPLGYTFMTQSICAISVLQSSFINIYGMLLYMNPAFSGTGVPIIPFILSSATVYNVSAITSAIIIMETSAELWLLHCSFSDIWSTGRGSVVLADVDSTTLIIESSTFANNYALNGGVFFAHDDSSIKCTNCSFTNNFAEYGGIVFENDDGTTQFIDCYFADNSALWGNVIFMVNTYADNYFNESSFENNNFNILGSTSRSDFIDLLQSSDYSSLLSIFNLAYVEMLLTDTDINKFRVIEDQLVVLQQSEVYFYGQTSLTNENIFIESASGSYVYFQDAIFDKFKIQVLLEASYSDIYVNDTVFSNINSHYPGTYFMSIQVASTLTATNWVISNVNNQFLYLVQVASILSNVQISNITIQDAGSYIYVEEGSFIVSNLAIQNIDSLYDNFLELYQEAIVEIAQAVIEEVACRFIYSSSCTLTLYDIDYSNNIYQIQSAQNQTGGMFLQSVTSSFSLDSSNFMNNEAVNFTGGIIYSEENSLDNDKGYQLISNCSFFNNVAYDGVVLAIYDSNLNVTSSQFIHNYALYSGGVLSLYCSRSVIDPCNFLIENSSFIQNQAGVKGGSIYYDYYAPQVSNPNFEMNQAPYGPNYASYPMKLQLVSEEADMNSGYAYESSLFIALFDIDNQIVSTDTNTTGTILTSNEDKFYISGVSSFSSSSGQYNLMGCEMKGVPGQSYAPYFSSSAIDTGRYLIVQGYNYSQFEFNVTFRNCVIGEVLKDDTCIVCGIGTYSLDLVSYSCLDCMETAQCAGGSIIEVNANYWRANTSTDSINLCLTSYGCPGGYNVTCATGYEGTLCQTCTGYNETSGLYYGRTGSYDCTICDSASKEFLKLIGMFFFYAAYVSLLAGLIIRGPNRKKDDSVLMRILTNYFQVVSLVTQLSLNWPTIVSNFFNDFTIVSSSPSNFFNIGCLLQTGARSKYLSDFMLEMIIFAILPFLFMIIVMMAWFIIRLIKPKLFKQTYFRNAISTSMVFIFLFYPTITKNCLQLFICYKVDGIYYLQNELNVQCFTLDHLYLLVVVGLPIILVWVLGFPGFILFMLLKKKETLDNVDTIIKYGIFYIGLNDSYLYWEIIVNNLKKIMCTVIIIAFGNNSPLGSCLTIALMLVFNGLVVRNKRPYSAENLNFVESNALDASFLTMLIASLYLVSTSSQSSIVSIIMFAVLLAINFGVILQIGYLLAKIYWTKYKYLFCKKKKEKKDELKTSEAEIIRDFKREINSDQTKLNVQDSRYMLNSKDMVQFSPDQETGEKQQSKLFDKNKSSSYDMNEKSKLFEGNKKSKSFDLDEKSKIYGQDQTKKEKQGSPEKDQGKEKKKKKSKEKKDKKAKESKKHKKSQNKSTVGGNANDSTFIQ